MHDSLRLAHLKRLPIGLQTQAKAGLPGSSHSDQALRRLCDLSTATERMHSKSFLPVFYAALDIVYIPTTGQLEAYMDGTNPGLRLVISSACWAITGVATLAGMGIVDPRALLELWSRIWPWIEFLHGYWEHLPAIDNFPEGSAYTLFVSVILALSRTTMKEAISHTHGVRAVLGRAWLVIIQAIPSDDAEWLANISEVLGSLEPSNIQTFQELVEGVGGTMAGLACIIVKHFDRVVHPHSPISTIFPCTWGVFILLDVCRKYDPDDCLPDHLVSNGAISSLITLLRALADASLQQAAMELMDHSFAVLCRILAGRRSHFKIMEGFRAGLIPMMKVTALKNIPRFDVYLENILLAILPSNMVYRSVLMELQESLPILEDLGTDRASGSIKDAWRVFTSLAKARLQLLRDYEAGKFLSSQGCDNLECGIIRAKSTFRRCSGCRTLCYCSRKCQIEDWRAGHRQACEHFLNLKLAVPEQLSTRDRSFLRALVHDYYDRHREEIWSEKLMCMLREPGQIFFFKFDALVKDGELTFESGRLVSCGHNHHTPGGDTRTRTSHAHDCCSGPTAAHWDYHISRGRRSPGRLELHVVRVQHGRYIFALRSVTSEIHDGLLQLAQQFAGKRLTEGTRAELKKRLKGLGHLGVQQILC